MPALVSPLARRFPVASEGLTPPASGPESKWQLTTRRYNAYHCILPKNSFDIPLLFFFLFMKHRGLGEEKKKEKEENVKKWTWSDLNRRKNVSHFRKGTEHDVVIASVNKCIWRTLKAIRSYSCTCVWESQMIILFQWAWDVNVSVIRYWKSFKKYITVQRWWIWIRNKIQELLRKRIYIITKNVSIIFRNKGKSFFFRKQKSKISTTNIRAGRNHKPPHCGGKTELSHVLYQPADRKWSNASQPHIQQAFRIKL